MNSKKYIKLSLNKKIGNTSIEVTEFFSPYTYEGLKKHQENKDKNISSKNESQWSIPVDKTTLNYFNINIDSKLNNVDCYYQRPISDKDWKNNSDNPNYISIFDYWSEVRIITEMHNINTTDCNIYSIVKDELTVLVYIAELKKDLSILLRYTEDKNEWNSSDNLPYDFNKNESSEFIRIIKQFFVDIERKSGNRLGSIIDNFLSTLTEFKRETLPNELFNEIENICRTTGLTAFKIKHKTIALINKRLSIKINEHSFLERKKYFSRLVKKYNLPTISSKKYREFAYFHDKLLIELDYIIQNLSNSLSDFNNLEKYFLNIPKDILGSYYGVNAGCFAIMKLDNQGYFALSGYYDCYHNTKKNDKDKHWVPYDAMLNLSNEINSKVFKNKYSWAPLIDEVLTYYSDENFDASKLEESKPLSNPINLHNFITNSTNGWQNVTLNQNYRLFSCCEKKLLAQICGNNYNSLEFSIRWYPCYLCMKPMNKIVCEGKTKVYALAPKFSELKKSTGLRDITYEIQSHSL